MKHTTVRQGLYGQRYFAAKLGVRATVGYNVDSFGHHAMLPQILRQSGMDAYIFTRPEPHEKGLPGRVFWWEADDGSRVLAYRIPFEYLSWGKDLERYVRRLSEPLRGRSRVVSGRNRADAAHTEHAALQTAHRTDRRCERRAERLQCCLQVD